VHLSEHEVLEAFAEPRCPVCALARKAARGYLAGVIEGGINDPALRDDWRRRGGLCGRHWREARDLEAPAFPLAILTQDLLAAELEHPHARVRCPACEVQAAAEGRYLESLRSLPLEAVRAALERGRGFVCLRHLRDLPEGELAGLLRARLRGILDDLEAFQRKYDHRHTHEPMGPEGDAWLRAIRALGGEV